MGELENKDIQSRKWNITINNPIDKGFTHDIIIERAKKFKSLVYMCLSDEEGSTPHTHIYLHFSSAVRFSSIQKKYMGGHFELARGTALQNRDYIFKEGKWENDKKHGTKIEGTQFEYGDLPLEHQGKRTDLADLYDMIKEGMSDLDIIETNPYYITHLDKMDKVRKKIREEKFKNVFRDVDVTYIYGDTGTGKTRDIMLEFGYSNVYRVTDYKHPFDNYNGQDIIVFDEFRSSIPLGIFLMYIEGHPCILPSRYFNNVACYTKVFIVSNISLKKQYSNVQADEMESYMAFLRRIKYIKKYTKDNIVVKENNIDLSKWQACNISPFIKAN